MPKDTVCRSCGQKIRFVTMAGTGAKMPVSLPGEVRIVPDGQDRFSAKTTFVSHFANCPQGPQWRRSNT